MLPAQWEALRDRALHQPVVLLAGEDALLADGAIAWLSAEAPDVERIGFSPQQIRAAVEMAQTGSFFGRARLVIAMGVQALGTQGRISARDREDELETLARYILRPDRENRLVLQAPAVDRRRRSYLDLERAGAVVPCEPPGPREAEAWLDHLARDLGLRLAPSARAAYLRSGLDLMALRRALEVAALATAEGEPIPGDVAAWAAPPSQDLRVFALTDAMLARSVSEIPAAVESLLRQDESPIGLLALVARQFRLLATARALAAEGRRQDEMARALGVHPFVARKVVQALARWPEADIAQAFELLLECDIALKSGAPQATTLELALVRLASGAPRAVPSGRTRSAAPGPAAKFA